MIASYINHDRKLDKIRVYHFEFDRWGTHSLNGAFVKPNTYCCFSNEKSASTRLSFLFILEYMVHATVLKLRRNSGFLQKNIQLLVLAASIAIGATKNELR